MGYRPEIRTLALTIEQVEEYGLPPNPAKETDSRFKEYRRQYGDKSWELDALHPSVFKTLISNEIESLISSPIYRDDILELERRERARLLELAQSFN